MKKTPDERPNVDNGDLLEEIRVLQDQVGELEESLGKMGYKMDELTVQNRQISTSVTASRISVESTSTKVSDCFAKIGDVASKLDEATFKLDELSSGLSGCNSAILQFAGRINELAARLVTLESAIDNAKSETMKSSESSAKAQEAAQSATEASVSAKAVILETQSVVKAFKQMLTDGLGRNNSTVENVMRDCYKDYASIIETLVVYARSSVKDFVEKAADLALTDATLAVKWSSLDSTVDRIKAAAVMLDRAYLSTERFQAILAVQQTTEGLVSSMKQTVDSINAVLPLSKTLAATSVVANVASALKDAAATGVCVKNLKKKEDTYGF